MMINVPQQISVILFNAKLTPLVTLVYKTKLVDGAKATLTVLLALLKTLVTAMTLFITILSLKTKMSVQLKKMILIKKIKNKSIRKLLKV